MCFFDDFINKPFGGMFDTNVDGKEDDLEIFAGINMMKESEEEEACFFDDD